MTDTLQQATICRYGVDDERVHGTAPYEKDFNESIYFNFLDARNKIGGILRTGNRPGSGYREYSVNIKLPGGAIAFRAGREECNENLTFGAAGLSLQVSEPTRRWTLSYRGNLTRVAQPARLGSNPGKTLKSSPSEACEIDLQWQAKSPMFVLSADGSGRATPGDSLMGTDHYEQFGVVQGEVKIGQQRWHLHDIPSMRDHTWGPRIWGTYDGEWLCGFLPGGAGMTLYSELKPSGQRAFSGALVFEGKAYYVQSFDVFTAYDGSGVPEERFRSVLRAAGLPTIPLDGLISHFSPLTMGSGEHRTRLCSMVVEFVNGEGGGAFAEFLRPLPPAGSPT
jgi:hypothetical protein